MLLCVEQKNPIQYREKDIFLPENLLNLHHMIYGCPVGEADINMWLSLETYFRNDRFEIIDRMDASGLSAVIQNRMVKEMAQVIRWAVHESAGTN